MNCGFLQRATKKALEDVGTALAKNPSYDLARAYTRIAALYAKGEGPARRESEKQKVIIAALQARMKDLEDRIRIKLDNMDMNRRAIGAKLG